MTGAFKHAGRDEGFKPEIDTIEITTGVLSTSDFAGIVCVVGDSRTNDGSYAMAGQELWRTDGTSHGLLRFKYFYP